MTNLMQIVIVAGLCALTVVALALYQRRIKKRRNMPLPDEHGSAWSNNAIRKQGKEGKGIR